uniref:Secreted protein n=1 Tax=Anopheles farauti TaxID=69004 RepID=A0A182Q3Y1_9DIPT
MMRLLLLVMMVVVGLILGVQPRLIDAGRRRTHRVCLGGVRQEVFLVQPQRSERLRLVGYLVVVMVRRTATIAAEMVVVVLVVRWNRWCIVGEQLHAGGGGSGGLLMLLLLLTGGTGCEMILAELKEAGGCRLLAPDHDTIACR